MSKKDPQNIYQFKITLEGIKPPIWRRIQVPETYSFWDLHVAIQDAMGWEDYHLHEFKILNPKTGIKDMIGLPTDDDCGYEVTILPGWKTPISSYFSALNKKAAYQYDFGDSWNHKIAFEKILPIKSDVIYPCCFAGERACPPEDCGGVWGYESLLEIMKDSDHEEYEERLEWLGGEFDSEKFNPDSIRFDNPELRLKVMLSGN